MDADVEDLLAGLSDASGGSDIEESKEPSITLDSQIASEFALIKQIFRHRSPIFDELLLTEKEFVSIVFIIGNSPEISKEMQLKLTEMMGGSIVLRLCIAFSEPSQKTLDQNGYDKAIEVAKRLEGLLEVRDRELAAIASEAPTKFPNLSALLEPSTVASLLVQIGGDVKVLAVTPASNLVNPTKSALAGDVLIAAVPVNFKRQALRILAGKVVLAARLDLQPEPRLSPSAEQWRSNVDRRITKLLAPPLSVQERALPRPVEKKPKRRGGKRIRIQKEKRLKNVKPEFIKFGDISSAD